MSSFGLVRIMVFSFAIFSMYFAWKCRFPGVNRTIIWKASCLGVCRALVTAVLLPLFGLITMTAKEIISPFFNA